MKLPDIQFRFCTHAGEDRRCFRAVGPDRGSSDRRGHPVMAEAALREHDLLDRGRISFGKFNPGGRPMADRSGGALAVQASPPLRVSLNASTRVCTSTERVSEPSAAHHLLAFAAMAHDLLTPLTRMKLRAETAPESDGWGKIVKDVEEMEAVVRQGLAFARNYNGCAENSSEVAVSRLVETLVEDYREIGSAVSIVGRSNVTLMTRPQCLRRILGNFIDNALKYGGSAEVRVQRGSGELVIEVLDRGPGIPDHLLDQVLQPFFRLRHDDLNTPSGAGLGLTIALQLSQYVGGKIRLRNREGGGLSAELLVPLADERREQQR